MNLRRSTLLVAGLLLVSTPARGAQKSEGKAGNEVRSSAGLKMRGVELDRVQGLLDNREREYLHPGVPLDVVGIEEGDNSFRENTPLLVGAAVDDSQVDLGELRERRLAMYNESATFSSPLSSSAGARRARERARDRTVTTRPALTPEAEQESERGTSLLWGFVLVIFAGTVVGLVGRTWMNSRDGSEPSRSS